MLETVYLLGMVGIFVAQIYFVYLAIAKKTFSIFPIILTIISWFLSSFTHFELIQTTTYIVSQNPNLNSTADVYASGVILLSMNYYILILTILLTALYIIIYIVQKAIEAAKGVRK